MTVVDTHLHLWDLAVSRYAWLGPQHGALHRSFAPEEAAKELAAAGVDSAVLVQAEDSLVDTRWLLDVAAEHDWVHGVVGWVRLDTPGDTEAQLDDLAAHRAGGALRGIRHLVHDDPRPDFLDLPAVRAGLALVAERGLAFDVPDAWPGHLTGTARLAGDLPGLTVVLDHLGKPPRGDDDLPAWADALRAVAARPNTVAKVSGLQRAGQPFSADALRPVLHTALDAFGADRLMVGGDWPMTLTDGGYAEVHAVHQVLLEELSADERAALTHRTAERVYGRNHHG